MGYGSTFLFDETSFHGSMPAKIGVRSWHEEQAGQKNAVAKVQPVDESKICRMRRIMGRRSR